MDQTIQKYGVELRPLKQTDLEMVRSWRNHPNVARFMVNQDPISADQQQEWFQRISASDRCAYYLAYYQDTPIGVVNIHSTEEKPLETSQTIEFGIYLVPDGPYSGTYRGMLLAFCPALAITDHCLETLGCERLVVKVLQTNRAALRFNAKLGYQATKQEGELIWMELDHVRYVDARDTLTPFIRF